MSIAEISYHLEGLLAHQPLLVLFGKDLDLLAKDEEVTELGLLIDGDADEAISVAQTLAENFPLIRIRVFPIVEAMTEYAIAVDVLDNYEVLRDVIRRWPLAKFTMENLPEEAVDTSWV